MRWLDALQQYVKNGHACVLVSISDIQGSTPRKVGARMLVGKDSVIDTIGGGALEKQAIEHSQSMLAKAGSEAQFESHQMVLGTDLVQCCGGKVTLNYEYHPACAFNVVVFGAGHVAQCVATILKEIPCRAHFIDARTQWLKKIPSGDGFNANISTTVLDNNAFDAVQNCPDKAYYLVMTHSHELDFELVEAIISRGDSAYCGLIASKSKAVKFKARLTRKGFTESELAKLTAPIGAKQHCGNLPMEVAVAVVNELLQLQQQRNKTTNSKPGKRSLTSQLQ